MSVLVREATELDLEGKKKPTEPEVGVGYWRWRKVPHIKEGSLASRSLKRQRNAFSSDVSRMNTALPTPQS